MTLVNVEGETVEVFWKTEPSESLEVLFDGVLKNYSRLSVNVAVWQYYLDAEVNRLRAEIIKASEAIAEMSKNLPPTLATDLLTVAKSTPMTSSNTATRTSTSEYTPGSMCRTASWTCRSTTTISPRSRPWSSGRICLTTVSGAWSTPTSSGRTQWLTACRSRIRRRRRTNFSQINLI